MATDADVCNAALILIGVERIETLDDTTDRARACKQFYGPTRDATTRAHPWNFAITRAVLVLEGTAPAYKWASRFALPTSPYCLRVLDVEEDFPGQKPWAIEGRFLVTNETAIKARYLARVADPTQFDALFYEALSARLASQLSFTLKRDASLITAMFQLYQDKIQEAKTIDAMEQTPEDSIVDDLHVVRR